MWALFSDTTKTTIFFPFYPAVYARKRKSTQRQLLGPTCFCMKTLLLFDKNNFIHIAGKEKKKTQESSFAFNSRKTTSESHLSPRSTLDHLCDLFLFYFIFCLKKNGGGRRWENTLLLQVLIAVSILYYHLLKEFFSKKKIRERERERHDLQIDFGISYEASWVVQKVLLQGTQEIRCFRKSLPP